MTYHFKIHKDGKGFWAECIELEGCLTEGENREKLRKNMQEALNLYLDEPESSKVIFPRPKALAGRNVEKVKVHPWVAFAMVLRQMRVQAGMAQKLVARKMGVPLYSYQRLERGRTANPRLDTLVKVRGVFPNLKLDDIF